MVRLYANENFPFSVTLALRGLGHDVLTTLDAGQAGKAVPDREVLDFAVTNSRTLLTLNRRHFIRLHKERPEHAGIIVCTVDPDSLALAERIDAALQATPEMTGQLIRINRPAKT